MRFRSKPVVIEASKWLGFGDHPFVIEADPPNPQKGRVLSAQGWVDVNAGDYIITEPRGDGHYPCAAEVFWSKYEPVDEPAKNA